MNALTTYVAAAALVATAAPASSQVSKTVSGETHVATATVEAIERSTREVTVKKSDGKYEVLYVPAAVKRFDALKVGDKITAKYYDTIVLRLKAPGEKDVSTSTPAVVRSEDKLAATASHQQTATVTITAIDQTSPSITFTGPHGWVYSSRVEDKQALGKVKVGDKVEITWTEALVVSID